MILWETIAAWTAVGWMGLMLYGTGAALWWRHAIRYHVQRCSQCRLTQNGKYDFGINCDGEMMTFTVIWPISIVLFTLKCIFYMPVKQIVVSVAKSPEQRAIEREAKDADFKVVVASPLEVAVLEHRVGCACERCISAALTDRLITSDPAETHNSPPLGLYAGRTDCGPPPP